MITYVIYIYKKNISKNVKICALTMKAFTFDISNRCLKKEIILLY